MNERSSDANGCLCPNNRAPTITRSSLEEQEGALASSHLGAQVESCAESLAEVSCVRNHVELCYKPPNLAPYSALGSLFSTRNAVAFVTDSRSDFAYHADCALSAVETHRLVRSSPPSTEERSLPAIWCIELSWGNHPDNPPCGIRVTEYISGQLYSGYLAILSNPDPTTAITNLLFQFTCKTNDDLPQKVPGQIFERPWLTNQSPNQWDSRLPWSTVQLTVELRNKSGRTIDTVSESTPIRIRTQLNEYKGTYKFMQVENCHVSRVSIDEHEPHSMEERLIISKGCPTQAMQFVTPSSNVNTFDNLVITPSTAPWLNVPAIYETKLFHISSLLNLLCVTGGNCSGSFKSRSSMRTVMPASEAEWSTGGTVTYDHMHSFLELQASKLKTPIEVGALKASMNETRRLDYKMHRLLFKCVFRLCTEAAWCSWPNGCESSVGDFQEPRSTFLPPSVLFLTRTSKLNVIVPVNRRQDTGTPKAKVTNCKTVFCSVGLHVLLMIAMVGLLTCLMGVFGLLLAKRYHQRYQQRRLVGQDQPRKHAQLEEINMDYSQKCKTYLHNHQPSLTYVNRTASALVPDESYVTAVTTLPHSKAKDVFERNNRLWLTMHAYSNPLALHHQTQQNITPNAVFHLDGTLKRSGKCSCHDVGTEQANIQRSVCITPTADTAWHTGSTPSNTHYPLFGKREGDNTGKTCDSNSLDDALVLPSTIPMRVRNSPTYLRAKDPFDYLVNPTSSPYTDPMWMHTEVNHTQATNPVFPYANDLYNSSYLCASRVDSCTSSNCSSPKHAEPAYLPNLQVSDSRRHT
ncbi:hypothetical protein PHET_00367 [Paragonimus heterotremus]|uniref:Uncharacterized protein n=1 Tax=Paragonimus heterotremus TaxID=100268 RepID=A0A8J4WVB9_9TREM|nr:hypothetical protein PHET_00367 [Paragonimus heterotremus]